MAASLVKGRQHPRNLLSMFWQVLGFLADPYKVEFQVWDASTAQPGTLLLPLGGGADSRVDVTTGAAHWATGCYAVHSPSSPTVPWAPAATCKRGVVVWYVVAAQGEQEQVFTSEFEVLDTNVLRGPAAGYALIQDLRDGGLAESTAGDAACHAQLVRWRDLIDRLCRQRFRPTYEAKRLRGNDTGTVFLSEPCWALEGYTLDGSAVDTANLRVYGSEGQERHNPRLELVAGSTDIFNRTLSWAFTAGVDNVAMGVWGFLDRDTLGPPAEVRRAVIMGAGLSLDGGYTGGANGILAAESTDGHSVTYATAVKPIRSSVLALLQHPAIREALDLYRGPIAMGAP